MIQVGDCLDVMALMDESSVDSIVCDPPYGLSFMGKAWDHGVPGVPFWVEALARSNWLKCIGEDKLEEFIWNLRRLKDEERYFNETSQERYERRRV